ncbi:MAG: CinA family protein [Acetobacteraceae bacterium]|nr:CinA family protein [Acetobacteraceae bacterium]
MQELLPLANRIGARLKARGETIAVFEGSAGGLVSAALLSVPGASNYFVGGGVIYTGPARAQLARVTDADMQGLRASTEPYALLLARRARDLLGTTWGVGESGATGPTGNRYGDAAGHCCFAIAGPTERAITVETGAADRVANMRSFARQVLETLERALG